MARLVSLKPSPGLDASTNAKEDYQNIEKLKVDKSKHGGTCSDHAAMAEGVALGALLIADQAGQEGRTLKVQANLGDEMHKPPLIWKALDEGIFGGDTGSIQNRHHKQLMYQLWFNVQQDSLAL